jgi:hypothetical protein
MPIVNATNSAVIEARTDVRVLARIIEGFQKLELPMPETRSALIRQIIEGFYDVLRQNSLVEPFTTISTEEALGVLESVGLFSTNRSGRNKLTLGKRLSFERSKEIEAELPEEIDPAWLAYNLRRLEAGLEPIPYEEKGGKNDS